MRRLNKAQVMVELSLIFVAVLLFFVSMMRIWLWLNRDMANRQDDYINTRSNAGGTWPIHNPAITDNDVF